MHQQSYQLQLQSLYLSRHRFGYPMPRQLLRRRQIFFGIVVGAVEGARFGVQAGQRAVGILPGPDHEVDRRVIGLHRVHAQLHQRFALRVIGLGPARQLYTAMAAQQGISTGAGR